MARIYGQMSLKDVLERGEKAGENYTIWQNTSYTNTVIANLVLLSESLDRTK